MNYHTAGGHLLLLYIIIALQRTNEREAAQKAVVSRRCLSVGSVFMFSNRLVLVALETSPSRRHNTVL